MCFNQESSLGVFLLCFSLSSYLLYRGYKINNPQDKLIGYLFITISLMQLLEYFIWKNQDCGLKNSFWSIMIVVLLFIQIVVYYLSVVKIKKINLDNKISYLMIVFFLLFLYQLYILILNKNKICSKPTPKNCRLEWGSLKYLFENRILLLLLNAGLYLFFMYYFSKINLIKNESFIKKNFVRITLIFAIFISIYLEELNFFNVFGSLWCFISAFYPIIHLLFP